MSIESWKAEFYPIPAKLMYGSSDEACILHSLRRYEGLKPENLLKHGLKLKDYILIEPDTNHALGLSAFHCALCTKYPLKCTGEKELKCIFIRVTGQSYVREYRCVNVTVTPMIETLQALLQHVRNNL